MGQHTPRAVLTKVCFNSAKHRYFLAGGNEIGPLCYLISVILFLAFLAACSEPTPAEVQSRAEPDASGQSPQGNVEPIIDQEDTKASESPSDSPVLVTTPTRQLKPADFQITEITVEPSEVQPEEPVAITARVANVGEQPAIYDLELVID